MYGLRRRCDFYPRPPRGGRLNVWKGTSERPNFYPRPPRGGRPPKVLYPICISMISIHALREEGDGSGLPPVYAFWNFYPRPPRGGRLPLAHFGLMAVPFLSTPSARRATCGAVFPNLVDLISIHALREEGDPTYWKMPSALLDFYPRPPRGGRPCPEPGVSAG